jgi:hypothetical protein
MRRAANDGRAFNAVHHIAESVRRKTAQSPARLLRLSIAIDHA